MPTKMQGLIVSLSSFGQLVRVSIDQARNASNTGNPLANKMLEDRAHASVAQMLGEGLEEAIRAYAEAFPEEALPCLEQLATFLDGTTSQIHITQARNRRAQKTTSGATATEEPILTPLWQAPPPRVPDPHGANAPEQQESVNFMAQRIFHVAAGFPGKAIRLLMERGITTFADIEEAGQGEMRRIFSEDPQIAGGIDSRMAKAYEMGYTGTKYWDEAYHTRQRETRGSTFAGGGGTS